MRKIVKLTMEAGDANYVKPGEYFAVLSADGKFVTEIKRRLDDLSFQTVVSTPISIETEEKEYTVTTTDCGNTVSITPTEGKYISKATVTIPELEEGEHTVDLSTAISKDIEFTADENKLGFSKFTLHIVDNTEVNEQAE